MYNFTIAQMENFDDFYKLKSEPNNIFWSGFDSAPNYESFKEHYKKELERKDRTIVFLYSDDEIAGYIAIDYLPKTNEVETAHGVLSSFGGRGLGRMLIEFAVAFAKEKLPEADYIIGWIADDNIGSIKNVLANGYNKTDEFEYRDFKLKEEKVKFHKYQLSLK